MPRVLYADFNDFDLEGDLPLTCAGSVRSIAALDEPLAEGETIILSDGEMRTVARVRRVSDGTWLAYGDWVFVKEGQDDAAPYHRRGS